MNNEITMLFKRQYLIAFLATIALGALTVSPANAQVGNRQGNIPGDSENNGCEPSGGQPQKCESVPVPALLPALMLLGGGTMLYKRRKRQNQAEIPEQSV